MKSTKILLLIIILFGLSCSSNKQSELYTKRKHLKGYHFRGIKTNYRIEKNRQNFKQPEISLLKNEEKEFPLDASLSSFDAISVKTREFLDEVENVEEQLLKKGHQVFEPLRLDSIKTDTFAVLQQIKKQENWGLALLIPGAALTVLMSIPIVAMISAILIVLGLVFLIISSSKKKKLSTLEEQGETRVPEKKQSIGDTESHLKRKEPTLKDQVHIWLNMLVLFATLTATCFVLVNVAFFILEIETLFTVALMIGFLSGITCLVSLITLVVYLILKNRRKKTGKVPEQPTPKNETKKKAKGKDRFLLLAIFSFLVALLLAFGIASIFSYIAGLEAALGVVASLFFLPLIGILLLILIASFVGFIALMHQLYMERQLTVSQ